MRIVIIIVIKRMLPNYKKYGRNVFEGLYLMSKIVVAITRNMEEVNH